jgi:hypothetical protein
MAWMEMAVMPTTAEQMASSVHMTLRCGVRGHTQVTAGCAEGDEPPRRQDAKEGG